MLTLPTVEQFSNFWGDVAGDIDDDRANELLQLGADLLWLATDIEDDPTDPRLARLVKDAICDMAVYLYVSREDINETYSPFSSERIGSYSYSKAFSATSKNIVAGNATGVPIFDRVVVALMDSAAYDGGLVVAGETVFNPRYVPLTEEIANAAYYPGNDPVDRGYFNPWG